MKLKEIFEYPLPIIKVDVAKIAINMNDFKHGYINIKNVGGGELSGKIVSNTDCIIFYEEEFEGNDILLEYEVFPSIYTRGDFIKSELVIFSNGGELTIPVFIKISNFDYLLCLKEKVFDIKEFYNFYLKNAKDAIRIFNSFEFIIWLKKIDFPHIEITEYFLNDTNKQRGIDNFFITAGVKEQANFDFEQTTYSFEYFSNMESDISAFIILKLKGKGYFEEDIFIEKECDWLMLERQKIFNKDFDEEGKFYLNFKIINSKLNENFEKNIIKFGTIEKFINIEVLKKQPLKVLLEKEYYETTDIGTLKILNDLGKEIMIEIFPKDIFLKFKGQKYLVGNYSEINFDVKLTGFLKAQLEFIKKPYITTEILIKAQLEDKIFKATKVIHIGNSFI